MHLNRLTFPTTCNRESPGRCWDAQAATSRGASAIEHLTKTTTGQQQSQRRTSHITICKPSPKTLGNALKSTSINKLVLYIDPIRIHWQIIQGGWQTHTLLQVSATGERYGFHITGNALWLWVILHLACKWNNNSLVYGDNTPDQLPTIN